MIVSFGRSALKTFRGKKGISIPKREVSNRLIGVAQEIAGIAAVKINGLLSKVCLLYTSPSPRDA